MQTFIETIPLSLYIHIPWCVRKCPYCDFNSHQMKNDLPEDLYVSALLKDLESAMPRVVNRRLVSIFFGGGTPSLFSANAIERILTGVNDFLTFGPDIEITLEANPGTVDESRFKGFRAAGVNRLSLGVQSLQADKLKKLGRIHDREQALRAIEAAYNANFENINLDLMHGLPGQSVPEAMQDLQDALRFQPPHLSWYQLTIEPNTLFHHQPPVLPIEDTLWDIQEAGKKIIAEKNFSQYEVSAYSQPNRECKHNLNYWEFGDYLGIGAGAHSKITDLEKNIITRYSQVKNPKDYLNPDKNFIASETILSEKDIIFEFMLNALRLTQGVSLELFRSRTGLSSEVLLPFLNKANEKKLLCVTNDALLPTELGQRFLNDLMGLFLA